MVTRSCKTTALAFTAVTVFALGCRQAASVLFDLPPPAPQVATPAVAQTTQVPQDTVRPPIESVRTPDSIVALLPKNADGGIDWGAAVRQGVIKPRKAPPGTVEPHYLEGFTYDLVLSGASDALFPHSGHVTWLTCESCHPTIVPRPGIATSMDDIESGKSCGLCHGKVAFTAEACSRCHADFPPAEIPAKLDTGIVLARVVDSAGPGPLPPSRFAHDVHRIRYRCSACHPALFALKAGADTLDMTSMRAGRSCGACHDGRAAFAISDCDRCHVRAGTPPP